jgi:hypothetical protein
MLSLNNKGNRPKKVCPSLLPKALPQAEIKTTAEFLISNAEMSRTTYSQIGGNCETAAFPPTNQITAIRFDAARFIA